VSFSKKRNSLTAAFVAVGLAIAGLLAFAIFRGLEEKDASNDVPNGFEKLLDNPKSLTDKDKEDLREQWSRLSPETKSHMTVAVMKKSIERFREETSKLTQEQRLDKIREEVLRLQRDREKILAEAKDKVQQLSDAEMQRIVKDSMSVYQKDLSAQERAELDPLAHEYIYQLNCVFR